MRVIEQAIVAETQQQNGIGLQLSNERLAQDEAIYTVGNMISEHFVGIIPIDRKRCKAIDLTNTVTNCDFFKALENINIRYCKILAQSHENTLAPNADRLIAENETRQQDSQPVTDEPSTRENATPRPIEESEMSSRSPLAVDSDLPHTASTSGEETVFQSESVDNRERSQRPFPQAKDADFTMQEEDIPSTSLSQAITSTFSSIPDESVLLQLRASGPALETIDVDIEDADSLNDRQANGIIATSTSDMVACTHQESKEATQQNEETDTNRTDSEQAGNDGNNPGDVSDRRERVGDSGEDNTQARRSARVSAATAAYVNRSSREKPTSKVSVANNRNPPQKKAKIVRAGKRKLPLDGHDNVLEPRAKTKTRKTRSNSTSLTEVTFQPPQFPSRRDATPGYVFGANPLNTGGNNLAKSDYVFNFVVNVQDFEDIEDGEDIAQSDGPFPGLDTIWYDKSIEIELLKGMVSAAMCLLRDNFTSNYHIRKTGIKRCYLFCASNNSTSARIYV
jgi:hypothetical protein